MAKVIRGNANVYELMDHEGEPIIGKFYEEELSAVDKKDIKHSVLYICPGARLNQLPSHKSHWRS